MFPLIQSWKGSAEYQTNPIHIQVSDFGGTHYRNFQKILFFIIQCHQARWWQTAVEPKASASFPLHHTMLIFQLIGPLVPQRALQAELHPSALHLSFTYYNTLVPFASGVCVHVCISNFSKTKMYALIIIELQNLPSESHKCVFTERFQNELKGLLEYKTNLLFVTKFEGKKSYNHFLLNQKLTQSSFSLSRSAS